MHDLNVLPELSLWEAVLERAIFDAGLGMADAWEWLTEWKEQDRNEWFSLPWVCEHLGLDPHRIKRVTTHELSQGKIRYSLKRKHVMTSNIIVDRTTATACEVYLDWV